jgi:hypothetical protein
VLVGVFVGVVVLVGVGVCVGVFVGVAEVGGNDPSFTNDITDLNDDATV